MSWANIVTIYLKELRDSLRDRRTLISTIVVPTLIMPLLMLSVGKTFSKVLDRARSEVPAVMLVGGEDSPALTSALRASPRFHVVPAADNFRARIADKSLRAAVRIPPGFDRLLATDAAPAVVILHHEGEIKSGLAASELERFFREYRERHVAGGLAARALPATLLRPFEITRENVAPPEKVAASIFGGFVPYLIILLAYTGAMYPAIDLTAGEKERGTMETLLCSPASRVEIVLGKFLMVLTGSLGAMVLALISMGVTATLSGLLLVGGAAKGGASSLAAATSASGPAGTIPMVDPLGVIGVMAMALPVAVLFSALIFTIALFARSTKEAQSYTAPLVIVVIMPAAIGLLPGMELTGPLALVPLLNLSLVCREMLAGVWHWPYIALIFGSSCAYAAGALALAVRMFQREDVMFRS